MKSWNFTAKNNQKIGGCKCQNSNLNLTFWLKQFYFTEVNITACSFAISSQMPVHKFIDIGTVLFPVLLYCTNNGKIMLRKDFEMN